MTDTASDCDNFIDCCLACFGICIAMGLDN